MTEICNGKIHQAKIPLLALVLSLLWPGAGHVYAGRRRRGIFFAVFTVIALLPPVYFMFFADARMYIYLLIPVPLFVFLYALLAVEAYGHAMKHNERYALTDTLPFKWPMVVVFAVVYLFFVVIVADSLSRFTSEHLVLPFMIGSHSMEPNFTTDELYLLDKRNYRHVSFKRGDVVLFGLEGVPGDDFVKRVVGLGGETVEIKSGGILVNGRTVIIPGAEGVDYLNMGLMAEPGMIVNVPEGHYFLLGDNSAHSIDSRYWGFVPRENIHGRVFPLARPWNKLGAKLKKSIDSLSEKAEK